MQYKVFHALGVVVAEVKSDTLFSVIALGSIADPVDFTNPELRFDVDMTRTPRRTANWLKVQIDDRGVTADGKEIPPKHAPTEMRHLPVTSIGSGMLDAPARGAFVGAIYFEHTLYDQLRARYLPSWKVSVEGAQLTSIVQLDTDGLEPVMTRFHGFYVSKVTDVTAGTITVSLATPDDAKELVIRRSAILESPPTEALCGMPALSSEPKVGDNGVLFVELQSAVQAGALGPKVPVGFGT